MSKAPSPRLDALRAMREAQAQAEEDRQKRAAKAKRKPKVKKVPR